MTSIVKVSSTSARDRAAAALRKEGINVIVAETWQEAAEILGRDAAAIVICDGKAIDEFAQDRASPGAELPRDAARALSHELRTPLSAMAGWLHLLESGKLDEAGRRKAIDKLRGNIDDQVRTIERFLGNASNQEKASK